ncbi:cytochrome c family protein [Bartonella sp. DGB1]|uniref:c-type cytochrome n=1 Tax=Bartonella sp. DGB1 TaxID=3239807 RepID=UPI0035263D89
MSILTFLKTCVFTIVCLNFPIAVMANNDLQKLMDKANFDRGRQLFQQCSNCHSIIKNGANRLGPTLWQIVNAPIGAHPSYRYSEAMKKANLAGRLWTEQDLFEFIKSPRKFMPGTRMAYRGMSSDQDIANLIFYLKSLN